MVERILFLQGTQAGGIRRGDVDRDVRGGGVDLLQAKLVVVDRALGRRVRVPADVDPEYAAPARAGDVLHERVHADVVETEAVDERLLLGDSEQSRPGIPRLRPRRHGADLDEPEAEAGE